MAHAGRYKICIFDLDGTLVDTMDEYIEIASEAICIHYTDISRDEAREIYRGTMGLPFSSEIRRIFPGDPRNEKVVEEFKARHIDYVKDVVFYPDAIPFISYLRENGYATAVSSSTIHATVENYVNKVAEGLFDIALGAADGMVKGAEHFGRISGALGFGTEEMLFVGDTIIDGRLAAENGVDFAARATTFKRSDFDQVENIAVVDTLDELKPFFPPQD